MFILIVIVYFLIVALIGSLPLIGPFYFYDWLNADTINIYLTTGKFVPANYPSISEQLNLPIALGNYQIWAISSLMAMIGFYQIFREEADFEPGFVILITTLIQVSLALMIVPLVLTIHTEFLQNYNFFQNALFARYGDLAATSHFSALSLLDLIKAKYDGDFQKIYLLNILAIGLINIVGGITGKIIYVLNAKFNQRLRTKIETQIRQRLERQLAPLTFFQPQIHINKGGRVNTGYRLYFQIKWVLGILPKVDWKVTSIPGNISLDDFVKTLFVYEIKTIYENLEEVLAENYRQIFAGQNSQIIRDASSNIGRLIIEKVNHQLAHCYSPDLIGAEEVLQTTSDQTISKFKQEILAIIAESLEEQMVVFRKVVFDGVSWELLNINRPKDFKAQTQVLSDGVKFMVSQNRNTLVVIEQKPTIRTLRFSSSFLEAEKKRVIGCNTHINTKKNLRRLSLPYIVFVFYFFDGDISSFQVYFRNKPLVALNDQLGYAHLPNNKGYEVCMDTHDISGKIEEQIQQTIFRFFNSEFNTDLNYFYLALAAKEPRLKTIFDWEENSSQDPKFILDINWLEGPESIWQIIRKYHITDTNHQGLLNQFRQIDERAQSQLLTNIDHIVERLVQELKTDRVYPQTIQHNLLHHLQLLKERIYERGLEQARETIGNETLLSITLLNTLLQILADKFKETVKTQILAQTDYLQRGVAGLFEVATNAKENQGN